MELKRNKDSVDAAASQIDCGGCSDILLQLPLMLSFEGHSYEAIVDAALITLSVVCLLAILAVRVAGSSQC